MIVTIAIILLSLSMAGVGYGLGMYFERVAWNEKIKQGLIPKPGEWRRHSPYDQMPTSNSKTTIITTDGGVTDRLL